MTTPPNQPPGNPSWGGQQPNPYGQPGGVPHGQPSANPPYGQPSANPPYGQPSANPPYGQPSANPPYGQPSSNPGYGSGTPQGPSANPPYGQASANAPYGQASSPTAAPAPRAYVARRQKIVLIVAGAVVLVMLALVALGAWISNQNKTQSEAVLSNLLSALKSGDVQAALSQIDTTGYDTANQPLLSGSVLSDNPSKLDYNPAFVRVEGSGDIQTYRIALRVDGVDKVVQWDVEHAGGSWKVAGDDVITQLSLDPAMPHVINGAQIAPHTGAILALPGSYTVTSGLTLLDYDPVAASFALHTGGTASFASRLLPTEGVLEAVQAQVRDKLSACIAERSQPTNCNWPLTFNNGDAVDGTIDWWLEPTDPASQLALPTDWNSDAGYVTSTSISYTTWASGEGRLWDDGSTGTFENESVTRNTWVSIDLSGQAPIVTLS